MEKETIAELQARQTKLEQKLVELKGKADDASKAGAKEAKAELAEIEAKIELAKRDEKIAALEANETKRKSEDAKAGVQLLIASGKIPTRDTETQEFWEKQFVEKPELISAMTGLSTGEALTARRDTTQIAKSGTAGELQARGDEYVTGGRSIAGALKRYYELVSQNSKINVSDPMYKAEGMRTKGNLAMEAAAVFKSDLAPLDCVDRWEHIPVRELGKIVGLQARGASGGGSLMAADNTDANLGTLSGTLVLQRTLPFFAFAYPELLALYTDFGDTPGLLNQTEQTRIVTQAPVQKYNTALDASGRPKGWDTVVAAVTTDVPITLTDYVAVPIVFSNALLASTTRRVFDEQSVLAIKALAGYFTNMLTNLATAANYNAYAVGSATVPTLYPTYAQGINNFSVNDLNLIGAAFTQNKVPTDMRGILLNPQYYSKLRNDPLLYYMYMGSAGTQADAKGNVSQFLSERSLPKLAGFAPYEAAYMPTGTPVVTPPAVTTPNVVGFAFQKAGAILKARLPTDFTQALNTMVPGSVTTVTDPDTKISIMLVQYVNLTQNYAEWRPEVMLGAAVGDKRAGLVLTSV